MNTIYKIDVNKQGNIIFILIKLRLRYAKFL